MKVEKPIFIYGIGRSGTTVIHRAVSKHPRIAWLSGLCGKFPSKPKYNRYLMLAIDYPLIGRYLQKHHLPWENYGFWEYYCRGFSVPCRDLTAADVTNKAKNGIIDAMTEIVTEKRDRLLVKITGWPRVGYLREIFPDARFIHVLRDARAVVNSRVNVDFWNGYGGPEKWTHGKLSAERLAEWERYERSFMVLGAFEWMLLMDANEKARASVDADKYLEVRYEDFCEKPLSVVRNIVEFSDLEFTPMVATEINKIHVKNENEKWKKDLSLQQQVDLEAVLGEYLVKYGYQ